jgi:Fe-S cluster biosynthesis and repair protein YggX
MINPEHRKFLAEERTKFLNNEEFAEATGYVPETKKP